MFLHCCSSTFISRFVPLVDCVDKIAFYYWKLSITLKTYRKQYPVMYLWSFKTPSVALAASRIILSDIIILYISDNVVGICSWFRCVPCNNDNQCVARRYCKGRYNPLITNSCSDRKSNGGLCTRDAMCLSGE